MTSVCSIGDRAEKSESPNDFVRLELRLGVQAKAGAIHASAADLVGSRIGMHLLHAKSKVLLCCAAAWMRQAYACI